MSAGTDTPATGGGTYAPRPGAAPLPRMIAAQAALETKMLLRNGEQLLLTVVIPTLLLVLFSSVDIVDTGAGEAVDFLTPGILALAVMSTASRARPSRRASSAATASSSASPPPRCPAGA